MTTTTTAAHNLRTHDLATHFGLDNKTITRHARRLGLGINLGGRAGYRFSEADKVAFRDALATPAFDPDTY